MGEYTIGDPVVPERECREKDLSYEVPVNVKVAFTNLDTGEIREQTVFLGNFPWMTDQGTFIINGTERVVVTQLVRSPGAYIMEPKDRDKQVFTANLMPSRGSWLELEIDKKGLVNVRIDRKRKLPITTLLRALPAVDENTGFDLDKTDEGLLTLFKRQPVHPHDAGEGPGAERGGGAGRGVQEAAPGRAAHGRQLAQPRARAVLRPQALRPDARRPLQAEHAARLSIPRGPRVLTTDDIVELVRRLVDLPVKLGVPEESKDFAADASPMPARRDRARPRRVRALRQPPSAHGGRADPGGLPDRPLPDGARRPRAPDHRGRGRDHAADDRQHPPGGRRAEGVLRLLAAVPVHGSDQLAGRSHAPPPPVGARRRRPDPRARTDRGARRAPDPLRPDVPDRDAGGPEHRPDRLARLLRQGLRARLRADAVPEDRQGQGHRGHRVPRRPRRRSCTRSPRRTPRSRRTASWSRRCSAAPATASPSRWTRRRSTTWTSTRRRSCRSRRR